jgi:NADPH-dependent curcumin reductase CurA
MADAVNRQVLLASRPDGAPTLESFRIHDAPMPEAGAGELLVRSLYLSLDPYMRGRMSDRASYADPVPIDGVMGGGSVGQVIAGSAPDIAIGDYVLGHGGWQEFFTAKPSHLRRLDPDMAPLSTALGVLGMPGMTAYCGLLQIGKPKAGDTLVVAAASGPVGGTVGQIGQIMDCRVVGLAGSDEKCAYVTSELGFDECLNHRRPDLKSALAAACPAGIDVYFENVGGPTGDAAMRNLAFKARVVVCGVIAEYNMTEPYLAPSHLRAILINRVRVEGFLVTDWLDRWPEGRARMAAWLKAGQITFKEDITEGLAAAPGVLIGLLEGKNFGKALVKVAER